MRLVVFLGPTLPIARAKAVLQAEYRPPAREGDVYLATLDRPRAIGLIDGYFHCVPSVWHKEILAAMAEGIHVFGASSMGALRAAELEPFGMEGVGSVFEAFRRGEFEDDDEVAVVHAASEEGYRPLSEAMVNVRATLRAAEHAGVLSTSTRETLEAIGKRLPYPDRCYPLLLREARREGLDRETLGCFEAWLPSHRIDQKQIDALLLLERMRERFSHECAPKKVTYVLSHTDSWEELKRRHRERRESPRTDAPMGEDDMLVDELIVDGTFRSVRTGALARALAMAVAIEPATTLAPETVREASVRFRREQGLLSPEQFDHWLESEHLVDEGEMVRFFREEALVRRIDTLFDTDAVRLIADQLRATSRYGAVLRRAEAKQAALEQAGVSNPDAEDVGMTESEIRACLPTATPSHGTPALGAPANAVRRAVLRELYYRRLCAREQKSSAASEAAGHDPLASG